MSAIPYADIDAGPRRRVGWLLAVWAAMVLLIVVIGGVTRLTESGLSITEWAPVTGIIPPLSHQAWEEAFEAYQRIPEYQQLNRGMTLDEFKTIYFWEYVHRLWARLIGLVIAVIFVHFLVRGGLSKQLNWRLATLLLLTAGQGALGWFMVTSGLADRTDVSQYRLAAHLGLALIIYLLAVWTAADLFWSNTTARESSPSPALQRAVGWITISVFITAMAGSFVAGLDGGRVYNTFPLMDGRLVPGGYFSLTPWWRNVFENVIANAQSFSPPNGTITIRIARDRRYVSIAIEDEGSGIRPEHVGLIFERFYTLRPKGEKFGTHSGLGLSISKQIVEAHRGTIHAENRLGDEEEIRGARIVIRLPLMRRPGAAS